MLVLNTMLYPTGDYGYNPLTHWGRVTHENASKQTIIGSDNGLSPDQHEAIIWTNDGILLTEPSRTNFSDFLIGIQIFSFNKIPLKMSSAKWRPFCLCHNVLIRGQISIKNISKLGPDDR